MIIINTANNQLSICSGRYDGRRGAADAWHVVGSGRNEKIKTYFSAYKLQVDNLFNLRVKFIQMFMAINVANDTLSISYDERKGTADTGTAWHVCDVVGSGSNPSLAKNHETEKKNLQT